MMLKLTSSDTQPFCSVTPPQRCPLFRTFLLPLLRTYKQTENHASLHRTHKQHMRLQHYGISDSKTAKTHSNKTFMKQTDNTRSVTRTHKISSVTDALPIHICKWLLQSYRYHNWCKKAVGTLPAMPPALDYLSFAIYSSTTRSCFHCCHQSHSSPHILLYVMLTVYNLLSLFFVFYKPCCQTASALSGLFSRLLTLKVR